MSTEISVYEAISIQHFEEAKLLFVEYAQSLDFDLCFQGFEEELAALPGKYSPPDGFILLAKSDNRLAGCIALKKLDDGICEMKRLYVRPQFRGLGIGKLLCDKLLKKARFIGYKIMRLDTIAQKMKSAINLYESYGFYEIPAYYDNPQDGVIYMELKL